MADQNSLLARAYFDRFPHDPNLPELFAPNFVFHHIREIRGPEQFREFMAGVSRAFPDFSFDVHHLMSEADLVAAHYTFSGTQQDTFLDVVASLGNSFSVRGMSLFRCADDKIEEIWVTFQTLEMMQQLGAMPELGT